MTKLSREQQEVLNSIPKEIYAFESDEFAHAFSEFLIANPKVIELSQNNPTVLRAIMESTAELIKEQLKRKVVVGPD